MRAPCLVRWHWPWPWPWVGGESPRKSASQGAQGSAVRATLCETALDRRSLVSHSRPEAMIVHSSGNLAKNSQSIARETPRLRIQFRPVRRRRVSNSCAEENPAPMVPSLQHLLSPPGPYASAARRRQSVPTCTGTSKCQCRSSCRQIEGVGVA